MSEFNGLGVGLHNVWRTSNAKSRSISAENFTGEKGKAAMATEGTGAKSALKLGKGWKVSPSISIPANSTVTLAEIEGPGAIQHIWNTVHPDFWRRLIVRFYWDGEETPSVETPIGDLFCNGWCKRSNVNSLPICVNPAGGFNSYWEMPFKKSAKITLENQWDEPCNGYYYQVDYVLTDVPDDAAYFHAQFRRSNPLPYKEVFTILDGVNGKGQYVGTIYHVGVNNSGWWGEGEIKFFMDGDDEFPTICGTGTEDYFGGAWNFEQPPGQYGVFSTPYLGLSQVLSAGAEGMYRSQQRFVMYRWHIQDAIRFDSDIKVTMQHLGWRSTGYLPMQDDVASVAVWYQQEPHAPFPTLPDRDYLEVI